MSFISVATPRPLKNGKIYLEHTRHELVSCPMCNGMGRLRRLYLYNTWENIRAGCYLCMGTGKTEEARAHAYWDAHR